MFPRSLRGCARVCVCEGVESPGFCFEVHTCQDSDLAAVEPEMPGEAGGDRARHCCPCSIVLFDVVDWLSCDEASSPPYFGSIRGGRIRGISWVVAGWGHGGFRRVHHSCVRVCVCGELRGRSLEARLVWPEPCPGPPRRVIHAVIHERPRRKWPRGRVVVAGRVKPSGPHRWCDFFPGRASLAAVAPWALPTLVYPAA